MSKVRRICDLCQLPLDKDLTGTAKIVFRVKKKGKNLDYETRGVGDICNACLLKYKLI